MKQIVHDFWLSFTINNEQIAPNLNSVFANKYDKIWCWPRNFDYIWEFLNSSISLLWIFIYNQSIRKSYLLLGFQVLVSLTLKVIKATFDFSRVSKYSVSKMNSITNGKKHYSLLPSAGHKVLMEVEDVNAVIVGNPQRIIGQQLMPHLIHLLDIIIIIIKLITFKSYIY